MPPLNEFSCYDVGVADFAFEFQELHIDSFPHLQGIAPEIRQEILRYLLNVDRCRVETENQDWVHGYQRTGEKANMASELPLRGRALQSWLFNESQSLSSEISSIKGSSPWTVILNLHPAILNVNKQFLAEGMNLIASENIFIRIRSDIPNYDVHLRKFGLPVCTYHKRPYPEMCRYESMMKASGIGSQSFRVMMEIDMRTDQNNLLSKLKHFYLVPFKDIDQVIRALYLTNGREEAWFRFTINLKHVPAPMKSSIDVQVTQWMSNFRPVGSISIIIPADGLESLPITHLLTQPFNIWEFVIAVQKITGSTQTTKAPLPARPKPSGLEDRYKSLTQLSQLSAIFTQNRDLLKRSHRDAVELLATLASAPLYTLLQLEYAATKTSALDNENNNASNDGIMSKWHLTILPLSTLLASLPPLFRGQRLQSLHIHIHVLAALGHERCASAITFELLVTLRMRILEYSLSQKEGPGAEAEEDSGLVARSNGCGLSKKTRALVGVTKYALERGFVEEAGWGEVWMMGLWEDLCRDGWRVVQEMGCGGKGKGKDDGSSAAGDGGDEKLGETERGKKVSVVLEDIWKLMWDGRFA
ncbi:hypothetical protein GJ744_011427 [Endocarpon pusillum]|uniref:Uncharacterized protein n=1 Tax=Endocarpon pusillum TaxID=364733 RepID=A0A8H7E302_9EURO|nr:hypothetical protein GJ744_011427 [Endocarpon pusillum]